MRKLVHGCHICCRRSLGETAVRTPAKAALPFQRSAAHGSLGRDLRSVRGRCELAGRLGDEARRKSDDYRVDAGLDQRDPARRGQCEVEQSVVDPERRCEGRKRHESDRDTSGATVRCWV